MSVPEQLTQRNAAFVANRFAPGLKILPALKLMLIGCVDPRVDPSDVLGLQLGEAAVIRNVGGRVTPALLRELALLARVSQSAGGQLGPGWDLIVLHHTDCGITRLADAPDLLAPYFGVDEAELPAKGVSDPHASIVADVAALRAASEVSGAFRVTGLVYDVATGRVQTVVGPEPLG